MNSYYVDFEGLDYYDPSLINKYVPLSDVPYALSIWWANGWRDLSKLAIL